MKKNTALYILAVIICLFLAAFVFHVPALRHLFHNLYGMLQSPYILVSAAVCAFLFINTKNYWLIIAGCGIAAALIIQFAVIGHGAGLYTIAVRALAFVTVVYLLNLVRLFLPNKQPPFVSFSIPNVFIKGGRYFLLYISAFKR